MKRREILFFARTTPFHNIGGMEIASWNLAKEFAKNGFSVSFITTKIEGREEIFFEDNIKIVALKKTKSKKYTKSWWRESKNYFLSLKEDIYGIISVSAGAYGVIGENLATPTIFQAHGTAFNEIKSKLKSKNIKNLISLPKNIIALFKDLYYYPKFSYIVASGDFIYQQLNSFPYKNLNPILIDNGIDTNLFKPIEKRDLKRELGFKRDDYLIISISRLHKEKGLDLSLKAFAKLYQKDKNSKYLIIGEGREKKKLKELVKKLKIEEVVYFLGVKEREEIIKYLNISNAFLFTTLHNEGMPLNLMEALACGLPVILSKHLNGRFKNSKELYFVNQYRSDEVAEALLNRKKFNYSLLDKELTLHRVFKSYDKLLKELRVK